MDMSNIGQGLKEFKVGALFAGFLPVGVKAISQASPFVKNAFSKISSGMSDNIKIGKIAFNNMGKGPKSVVLGSNLGNADEALGRFSKEFEKAKNGIAEEASISKFTYKNNPMDNPKAAKDIMENPKAIYGYSPKSESNLSKFKVDWTNPEQVADAQLQRIKYQEDLKIEKAKLNQGIEKLLNEGYSIEDIARMKVNERNTHRIDTYLKEGNLEGLESMKARNMRQYQNPNGPTPEQLFKKYGSWEEIINSSVRSNQGMDACTGLYDIYGGN